MNKYRKNALGYYGIERMKRSGSVEFLAPVPLDSFHGSSAAASDADADVEDVRAGLLADEPTEEGVSKVE